MKSLKKLMAVMLTVVILLTLVVPVYAAVDNAEKGIRLQAIGLLAGGEADLRLDEDVTRIQGLTFAIRAAGKEAEALAMTDAEVQAELLRFSDADDIPSWNGNGPKYVAYAVRNGITVGDGKGSFRPLDKISGRAFLVFLLKSGMGYADVITQNAPDVAVEAGVLTTSQALAYAKAESGILRGDAAAILYGAAMNGKNADGEFFIQALIDSGFVDKQVAIQNGFVNVPDLLVLDITAGLNGKDILVEFNRAVADDDKVTIEVKKQSDNVLVITTWHIDRTKVILSGITIFDESDYTVRVLKDGMQIASETVRIIPQKIAKIEITSPSVSVITGGDMGYVAYKVYDQYGHDITVSDLANSLSVHTSIGFASIRNGLMTITTNAAWGDPSLSRIQNITVELYDASTGVRASAVLPVFHPQSDTH